MVKANRRWYLNLICCVKATNHNYPIFTSYYKKMKFRSTPLQAFVDHKNLTEYDNIFGKRVVLILLFLEVKHNIHNILHIFVFLYGTQITLIFANLGKLRKHGQKLSQLLRHLHTILSTLHL